MEDDCGWSVVGHGPTSAFSSRSQQPETAPGRRELHPQRAVASNPAVSSNRCALSELKLEAVAQQTPQPAPTHWEGWVERARGQCGVCKESWKLPLLPGVLDSPHEVCGSLLSTGG